MKKIFFLLLGLSILMTACKKMQVDAPDLEITLANATLKVGDTAKFSLSGYADFVNFYSGELGKNYDRKDSFNRTGGNPEFQFSSAVTGGLATTSNLSVLVSTDFNGKYDAASVTAATWTNVTSRIVLGTSTTALASGIANLNDLKVEGKPMYIAFRYLSNQPATLAQRQWTISAFQFRTKFTDGTLYTHAASNADAVFGPVSVAGDSATWVAGSSLTHVGLAIGKPGDDDWAITKTFDLSKANSDASGVTIIKNYTLTGNIPAQFTWKYATAGTYKAVFVIRNATVEDSREIIKTFNITVNP